MKTLNIAGTMKSVSFYEDDTIQTIRQYLALEMNSHPDRMFVQIKVSLPADHYIRNPKEWTALFLRLSIDGKTITVENMKTYLEEIRLNTGVTAKEITKEEWEEKDDYLAPIYNPGVDFEEYRVFGVPEAKSFVLPLPPKDVAVPGASIPVPQTMSLFETLYSEPIEFQVTIFDDEMSDLVRRNYFPLLKPDTPNTIESMRSSIEASRNQYEKLLRLDTPSHETLHVLRAKWFVSFVETSMPAPRSRFEQIFYGMTLSEKTQYVGYFTAKNETMRHKFYVEDPKTKKPLLDTAMLKAWYSTTQPQRRLPTLLFYRGKSRSHFDRIAITPKDITIDVHRDKKSTETLDEMKKSIFEWMKTFDAVVPFVSERDIELENWALGDLSILATYPNEIQEFDMHRFPCLTSLFSVQNDVFRLLRAERTSDDIDPLQLQALQILTQDDAERTPNYLAQQMNMTIEEATDLFRKISQLSEDINIEKTLRNYPVLKFSNKEVILKFITNVERTLQYASILRFVLTSNADSVNEVCPRRLEKVAPKVAIPQQELNVEDAFAPDEELNALLGFSMGEEEPEPQEEVSEEQPEKKLKIQKKSQGTYNYFNARLQKFDPDTFDKTVHPSKCDKPKQVVALTAEERDKIGSDYNYDDAPDAEKLPLQDPDAVAICPPYWCMRDEIPLRESQLKLDDDGELHCPVCSGKVRSNDTQDTTEYTVIKRDGSAKFPDFMKVTSTINKRRIPCCYQKPRASSDVLTTKEDVSYVLDATSANVPARRMVYLSEEVASRLRVKTSYETSVKKGRLLAGEADVFRVGLGRPIESLPALLDDKTKILPPSEAREKVISCSFFRTWKKGTTIDEKVASIQSAFESNSLSFLEELEYATSFLRCEVVLMKLDTMSIQCGFWSETLGANSRTILVMDNTILCQVSRSKSKANSKPKFNCDLRNAPFTKDTLPLIRELHQQACSANVPSLNDAIEELRNAGVTDYQVILDPYERIQAVFVPDKIILPVRPTATKPDMGVTVRRDYSAIRDDELPDGVYLRNFLKDTKHPGFKKSDDLQDINGLITEFLLSSGYRVPIRAEEPDEGETYAAEVVQTIRNSSEDEVVNGEPNPEDTSLAQEISYSQEIYEFLLYSLSKDLESDDFGDLRTMIETKNPNMHKAIKKWFQEHSYKDTTKSPVDFISKVRTPCGQMTTDACKKSTLCGINKGVCKIRVKPIVDEDAILKRITKTLRDNDKQRALVLDGTVSPFFSTILFLELPHEWITTSV